MKRAGIILSWVVRILFLLIAIWQVLGFLPVLIWLPYLNLIPIPAAAWMAAIIKILIMFVCFGAFWGLGKLIKRLNGTSQETTASVAAILRRKPATEEAAAADTQAAGVLAPRERWHKKLVFKPAWRLAVSTIPSAFLMVLVTFYVADGEFLKERAEAAHYSEWISERRSGCENALAEERAKDPRQTYDLRVLEAVCAPPKKTEARMYSYYRDKSLREVFLPWVTLSASLFVLLTITAVYFRERKIGWRRLSIVAAGLLAVISGLITFILSDGKALVAFLFAVATFPVSLLLILGGRSVVKWVRDGFTSSKQT
jgi:hypothetical protein